MQKKEEQLHAREIDQKRLDELEQTNKDLRDKLARQSANRQILNIDKKKKQTIGDIDPELRERNLKWMQLQIMREKGRIVKNDEAETIIKVPSRINIQELFDTWYKDGNKDPSFLMQSLDALNGGKARAGHFNQKVLQCWNVHIEGKSCHIFLLDTNNLILIPLFHLLQQHKRSFCTN